MQRDVMPDAIRECIADDDTTLKAGEILKPMYFLCKRNILAKSSKIAIYFIKVSQLLGGRLSAGALGGPQTSTFQPWLLQCPRRLKDRVVGRQRKEIERGGEGEKEEKME